MSTEKESKFEGVNYYVVIHAQVLHDNRLTPLARLIYGELSALANIQGFAWISNRKMASKYRVSIKTISRNISKLQELGYIKSELIYKDEKKEVEQRNIYIEPLDKNVNSVPSKMSKGYGQNSLEGMDKKVKDNNTSNNTMNNTNNNIADKSADSILDERFEKLWKLYPRKAGSKQKAKSSYKKAIKKGTTDEKIKNGIINLINERRDITFIPHGQTWFCNERWNDEPLISSPQQPIARKEYTDLDLPF
ncbi:helix-turn-helix domain-containing protein [Lactococcus lactis subsp. lactis]|uniref:helix-turn-helix domain-containing protein n=1 Tax=Lactococcus lactis TaxID=1358 RepID=UPI001BB0539F|nr:helix-turn-helix domain-containing protein [Lactococcus lactis]MBS3729610.1 helix-turn-helix domain-containing protein [Lactococcus lactis subsp. lactis]